MDEIPMTQWKNGDILVIGNWIFILSHFEHAFHDMHVIVYHALWDMHPPFDYPPYIMVGKDTGIGYYEPQADKLRYATNYEKRKFFEALQKEKKTYWNETRLRIEDELGELIPGRLG